MIKRIQLGFYLLLVFVLNLHAEAKKGVFLWPSSIYYKGGTQKIITTLKENEITDIFLLVKGEAGASFFPSPYTYKDLYYRHFQTANDEQEKQKYLRLYQWSEDTTLLANFIDQAHRQKIKVHAWFMVSGDRHFVEQHPGSEVVHLPKPGVKNYPYPVIDKIHVNLAYPTYKSYFLSLVERALKLPFDGLMLDKIRYTHLAYTWDNIHLSRALRAGIDVDKVMDHACRTLYGKEDDKELFIYDYRDGDKDITGWVKLQKEDIEDFVKGAAQLAREKGIEFSAAFMPEGAYDENYADVYCAQNYTQLSPYFDFIVIMAYAKDFKQPASWVKMVVENGKVRSKCKIWAAVQGYGDVAAEFVSDQIKNARLAKADGIAVFRYGEMNPLLWQTFREANKVKLKKQIKQQVKGIIFSGGGTIRNCWLKSMQALLLSDTIIPLILKEDDLTDYSWFRDKRFIIIPGGGGSSEAKALGESGLSNIERFVAAGGGYVGICAGSFLPVKGYWGNLTEKLQIVNAEAIDIDHWNRGSGEVELEIVKKHPIFQDVRGSRFTLNYYSGPVLRPADLLLPAYKELAIFKTDYHENGARPGEMIGKTAILETQYNKGRIILFSPHPELTPGKEMMLVYAVGYVSGKK